MSNQVRSKGKRKMTNNRTYIHRQTDDERSDEKFFDRVNVKMSVLNYFIIAVIGIVTGYSSFMLAQQSLANDVTNLKEKVNEKTQQAQKDTEQTQKNLEELKSEVKQSLVTREVLDLKLKPLSDEQKAQREILEKIAAAVNATK